MEYVTKSPRETKELGKKLATSLITDGRWPMAKILALTGELGSGKTTFVQGLAEELGIKGRIISPTFILVRKYDISPRNFYHIDLYRVEGDMETEVKNLGIEDIWKDSSSIVVIEWAEKIRNLIPKGARWISFENLGGDRRKIKID